MLWWSSRGACRVICWAPGAATADPAHCPNFAVKPLSYQPNRWGEPGLSRAAPAIPGEEPSCSQASGVGVAPGKFHYERDIAPRGGTMRRSFFYLALVSTLALSPGLGGCGLAVIGGFGGQRGRQSEGRSQRQVKKRPSH